MDPRITALFEEHSYQRGRLLQSFLFEHPEIEVDVTNADWTPEQTQAWKQFTGTFEENCMAARAALAQELNGS